jgi:hypothetical protein
MPVVQQPMHVSKPLEWTRRMFYTGDGALKAGQGLCFERDFTDTDNAATDCAGERDNRVELPNWDNSLDFAGVVANDVRAKVGGQWVNVHLPGSVCPIAVLDATVLNTTRLVCVAGGPAAGYFVNQEHFEGRGTARALQTTETASDTALATPISNSLDGAATLTAAGVLTATGKFANAVVGDRIFLILGRKTSVTETDHLELVETTITVRTSDDAVTVDMTNAIGTTWSSTLNCCFYCVRNEPKILAKLNGEPFGGEESGLIQFYNTKKSAVTDIPLYGITYFFGGITLDADMTQAISDGLFNGHLKGFEGLGTLTTSDIVLTIAGIQLDGTTALATASIDAAGEAVILEWFGDWYARHYTATIA